MRTLYLSVLFGLTFARCLWPAEGCFRRGDANEDGLFDVSDAVKILFVLFLRDVEPACQDRFDVDDDGAVDITDSITALEFLFREGAAPRGPFASCGLDYSQDALTCSRSAFCGQCPECYGPADLAAKFVGDPPIGCMIETVTSSLGITITMCPVNQSGECNGQPGCPILMDRLVGSLDLENRAVNVSFGFSIDDLPMLVEADIFPPTLCSMWITFTAVAHVPLLVEPSGEGRLLIAGKDASSLEAAESTFEVRTVFGSALLCEILQTLNEELSAAFINQFAAQIETIVEGLQLEELEGRLLCP